MHWNIMFGWKYFYSLDRCYVVARKHPAFLVRMRSTFVPTVLTSFNYRIHTAYFQLKFICFLRLVRIYSDIPIENDKKLNHDIIATIQSIEINTYIAGKDGDPYSLECVDEFLEILKLLCLWKFSITFPMT